MTSHRPNSFIISASDHGTMIVNRNDYREQEDGVIGVGAQILNDLNITNMILLTNSKPNVIGLEGYGLHIDGWQSVSEPKTDTADKG